MSVPAVDAVVVPDDDEDDGPASPTPLKQDGLQVELRARFMEILIWYAQSRRQTPAEAAQQLLQGQLSRLKVDFNRAKRGLDASNSSTVRRSEMAEITR